MQLVGLSFQTTLLELYEDSNLHLWVDSCSFQSRSYSLRFLTSLPCLSSSHVSLVSLSGTRNCLELRSILFAWYLRYHVVSCYRHVQEATSGNKEFFIASSILLIAQATGSCIGSLLTLGRTTLSWRITHLQPVASMVSQSPISAELFLHH